MKKNLKSSFAGIFLSLLLSITANGQVSITSMQSMDDMGSSTSSISENGGGNIQYNEFAKRVVKNFERKFKNVANARWYESSFGFVVKFDLKEISYRVDLDRKGNWLHTIRMYDETKLPEDIKRLVKNSYYDYDIILVQEIEVPLRPLVYVIHLDGKTDIIKLRLSNGEMDEWQKFNKPTPAR